MTAALLVLLALAGGPARGSAQETPPSGPRLNLVVISLGNVGTRHMSLYGYRRPTTPWLESWAKGAVVFERAYAPASWTLPVAATVMTGLPPRVHGLMSRTEENLLDAATPTLAEVLAARGWDTAAFAGGLDYDPEFGHLRGFGLMAENPPFERTPVTVAQARRWLRRRAKRPFYLFLHGYDAHCPFTPDPQFRGAVSGRRTLPPRPPGAFFRCGRTIENSSGTIMLEYSVDWCRGRPDCPSLFEPLTAELVAHMRDSYDDTIRQEDHQIATLLRDLPADLVERTVFVVYGDHGEMFVKNGRFGRLGPLRSSLYEDVIRVPLVIKAPGLAPRRLRTPVELASLPATVLELLGLDPALLAPGARPSLAAAARGAGAPEVPVFAGLSIGAGKSGPDHRMGDADAVIDGRWKLIRERSREPDLHSVELYDLKRDPEESRNLAPTRPAEVQRLEALIEARRREDESRARKPGRTSPPEDLRRAARAFGYW